MAGKTEERRYTNEEILLVCKIRHLTQKHIQLCDQGKRNSPEAIATLELLEKLIYEFSCTKKNSLERSELKR